MLMYVDDHNNTFPPGTDWYNALLNYIDATSYATDIYICPTHKGHLGFAYGYNFQGFGEPVPGWPGKNINTIKSPSNCIMVADSYDFGASNPWIDRTVWLIGHRHFGGANVVFVDGHVSWYLQSFLLSQGEDWWNY